MVHMAQWVSLDPIASSHMPLNKRRPRLPQKLGDRKRGDGVGV